jgi:hypothetical protein
LQKSRTFGSARGIDARPGLSGGGLFGRLAQINSPKIAASAAARAIAVHAMKIRKQGNTARGTNDTTTPIAPYATGFTPPGSETRANSVLTDFVFPLYSSGPKSGKKIQIWKIFFEIRSRNARILRFAIVRLRVGVLK